MRLILNFGLFLLALAACSADVRPTFHAEENPERLSDWGVVSVKDGSIVLSDGVVPYDLATPLFTDYASKLRTVWTPDGQPAEFQADSAFDFPVGTIITKTFYYSHEGAGWSGAVYEQQAPTVENGEMPLAGLRLLETRLLVRREAGWDALPYVWNEEQTEATLQRIGAVKPLTMVYDDRRREAFPYIVPNVNQCAGCHAPNATTKEIEPIGLKARHLNKPSTFATGANQLDHWRETSLLVDAPEAASSAKNASWTDMAASLNARARAYLDINCSHCHNAHGPADTSGLDLEPQATGPALGLCKVSIAAGSGSGGRPYDIVPGDPEQSITVFRMETTDPGAMMPELGRSLSHEEGVALIAEWIAAMEGGCA